MEISSKQEKIINRPFPDQLCREETDRQTDRTDRQNIQTDRKTDRQNACISDGYLNRTDTKMEQNRKHRLD